MTIILWVIVTLQLLGLICFAFEDRERNKRKQKYGINYWEH